MTKATIIVASTRPSRVGHLIGDWVEQETEAFKGFTEVELVDLAERDLPFMNEPHHPRLKRYVHQHTLDWSATVSEADAFIFVMPEYNYGYNAELKNAIDYLHREWQYKPVGLVSYGGVSGSTDDQAGRQALPKRRVLAAVQLPWVTRSAIYRAISSALVAAGDGAFRTCT